METTENLRLPYILPAQAQKHVTHNEALRHLDAIVQIAVDDRDLTVPPAMPEEGARYIVAGAATGAWAGQDGRIAAFQDGAWAFFVPNEGWIAWVSDEDKAIVFDGAGWVPVVQDDINPVPVVGVNATADAVNRLAVKSDAVLMSHDDETPGTGDIRLKINKASTGGTASLLYQTNWSGRAEFGLAGDDNFRLKVSSNGTAWREALVVDRTTGSVSMPATVPVSAPFNLLKDAGRFAGSPEPQSASAPSFALPGYFSMTNGSSFAPGPKFITNNTDYGGNAGTLDPDVKALIDKLRDGSNAAWRRHGVEFHLLEVTAGNGTATPLTVGASTYYLCMTNTNGPSPAQMSVNFHILVKYGFAALMYNPDESTLRLDGMPCTSHQVLAPEDGWKQVTRLVNRNPRQFFGYNNVLKRLYATPGTVLYLAAPFFAPGHIPVAPGLYYGVIPSLEVWR